MSKQVQETSQFSSISHGQMGIKRGRDGQGECKFAYSKIDMALRVSVAGRTEFQKIVIKSRSNAFAFSKGKLWTRKASSKSSPGASLARRVEREKSALWPS